MTKAAKQSHLSSVSPIEPAIAALNAESVSTIAIQSRPLAVKLGRLGGMAILAMLTVTSAATGQSDVLPGPLPIPAEDGDSVVESECSDRADNAVPVDVPRWAHDAIWYQILIPRFRNGRSDNDLPYTVPWCQNWLERAEHEEWELRVALHFRRYGGDIQGLRDQLGYLQKLGVNAICLSPVFQADSENKYGTTDYRHVDSSFGPPTKENFLTKETLSPDTWQWSPADEAFIEFLAEAHRRGLRVVIDGVFNHCGRQFWAWKDVVAKRKRSAFADWFEVSSWEPELHWNGWDGPDGLFVNYKRNQASFHPELEEHLLEITRRWMDPNGDGDPSDGVDGWRLDAADEVPTIFWRRFRNVVKRLNPQAIIIGEVWGNAQYWLQGDMFDAVTNYTFAVPTIELIRKGNQPLCSTTYTRHMEIVDYLCGRGPGSCGWNILGTHDTPRAVSMLSNQYRGFAWKGLPASDARDSGELPAPEDFRRLALAATMQFTCPGTPMIYYGDEVGMYGADDPFCRAAMWWPDVCGDDPNGRTNHSLFDHYRRLSGLRRNHISLRRGHFSLLLADDARRVMVYSRRHREERLIVAINADTEDQEVTLQTGSIGQSYCCDVFGLPRDETKWHSLALPGGRSASHESHIVSTDKDGLMHLTIPALAALAVEDIR